MRYRLTCLTPMLVGNGDRLSPIDYMVWRDQVNVLDQTRIFRLLARGPKLDSYLTQIRRTDKLDFASWGGFAQNFADRRIPFEHESLTEVWNQTPSEHLFIPTFTSSPSGPYLPGTVLKGALRTALLYDRWKEGMPEAVTQAYLSGNPSRSATISLEEKELGSSGRTPLRMFAVADSAPVSREKFRVFLTRVSALSRQQDGRLALGWKVSPRGAAPPSRVSDSTPTFAEMAESGAVFHGVWQEKGQRFDTKVRQSLGWKEEFSRQSLFDAANRYADRLLDLEAKYFEAAGLESLRSGLAGLRKALEEARLQGACLVNLGWGGGLLGKAAWIASEEQSIRKLMEHVPAYSRALRPGVPFPKTRRVVYLENRPASLPGWARLEVDTTA